MMYKKSERKNKQTDRQTTSQYAETQRHMRGVVANFQNAWEMTTADIARVLERLDSGGAARSG